MNDLPPPSCPCCDAILASGLTDWHWRCRTCGYEKATLQPVINDVDTQAQIDETVCAQALRGLREASFRKLLDWIAHDLPSHTSDTPPRLLDVGAGYCTR